MKLAVGFVEQKNKLREDIRACIKVLAAQISAVTECDDVDLTDYDALVMYETYNDQESSYIRHVRPDGNFTVEFVPVAYECLDTDTAIYLVDVLERIWESVKDDKKRMLE